MKENVVENSKMCEKCQDGWMNEYLISCFFGFDLHTKMY